MKGGHFAFRRCNSHLLSCHVRHTLAGGANATNESLEHGVLDCGSFWLAKEPLENREHFEAVRNFCALKPDIREDSFLLLEVHNLDAQLFVVRRVEPHRVPPVLQCAPDDAVRAVVLLRRLARGCQTMHDDARADRELALIDLGVGRDVLHRVSMRRDVITGARRLTSVVLLHGLLALRYPLGLKHKPSHDILNLLEVVRILFAPLLLGVCLLLLIALV